MNETIDLLNIQPLSSTSSSYSSSSCSSSSSGSKTQMANSQNSPPIYSQCSSSSQDNLSIVVNDLKQISCTLSLLARQIDQVVHKIDSNLGNSVNQDQNNLKALKNFTKIINPNLIEKNGNLNRANSKNRNENILNNYLNNQKMFSDRIGNSNHKDFVDNWNQRNESLQRTKCTRSKSQPAFKDSTILVLSSTNTSLSRVSDRPSSSPISSKFLTNENGDSSFYEDQLDNELEGIKENSADSRKPNEPLTNIKEPSNNGIQKSKAKVAGTNHHVSFNINNAIYTSKQETPIPIPISILKQTKMNEQTNSSSSSSNVSPLQSSMKKSPAVHFNSVAEVDTKNSKNASKSVRIDTKTTIL